MKNLILIGVLIFSLGGVMAQETDKDKDSRRDKIKALAVAHITEQLELTTQEAEKFWPVYNRIKDKHRELEKEKRKLIDELKGNFESLTEAKAQEYVDQMVRLEQQINESRTDYNHEEIVAIIGAKRFLKLNKAEHDFRRKMIKEYKERHKKGKN